MTMVNSLPQSGVVTGVPVKADIKTPDQILRLAESCQLARQVLDKVGSHVQVRYAVPDLT